MGNDLSGDHIKATNDHWWPRSIQKLWADDQGWLSQLSISENVQPYKPSVKKAGKSKKRGSILRGHQTVLEGPWAETIERMFDDVDREPAATIDRVQSVASTCLRNSDPKALNLHEIAAMVRIIVGIQVRSPAFRRRGLLRTCYNGHSHDPAAAANIKQQFNAFGNISTTDVEGFKIALIYSDADYFIFGDGSFDNAFTTPPTYSVVQKSGEPIQRVRFKGESLIALTPKLAVHIDTKPIKPGLNIYRADDRLSHAINLTTANCSIDRLFGPDSTIIQRYLSQVKANWKAIRESENRGELGLDV